MQTENTAKFSVCNRWWQILIRKKVAKCFHKVCMLFLYNITFKDGIALCCTRAEVPEPVDNMRSC